MAAARAVARVVAVAALAAALARTARAEPVAPPPPSPRVLHVPTAWLIPRDHVHTSAGVTHRGAIHASVVAGLAGLADVDVTLSDDVGFCDPCAGPRTITPTWLGSAGFKLAAPAGAWFRAQPALAVGMRRSFAARAPAGSTAAPEVATLFAVASARAHGVAVHLGASAWATARGARPPVRPFAGLEWRPPQYPRTTLLGDLSWLPELGADGAALRLIAGWGIRYQALSWGAVELAVRHREDDALAGSTVFVRVAGSFDLRR